MSDIRLNKHIAQLGIASRRKADELISAGHVMVNGEIVTEMGMRIDPATDDVQVLNEVVPSHTKSNIYVLVNKPVDYITSTTSEQGQSVLDLITKENYISQRNVDDAWQTVEHARLFPVGRLDKDSEGLVLLTNDGDLTHKMTHPSFEHEKEYEVTISDQLKKHDKKILEKEMDIGNGEYVQGITITDIQNRGKRTIVTVILKEGKNRQIRRMFGRLGYDVVSLKRIRIGNFTLGTLPVGRWVVVSKK